MQTRFGIPKEHFGHGCARSAGNHLESFVAGYELRVDDEALLSDVSISFLTAPNLDAKVALSLPSTNGTASYDQTTVVQLRASNFVKGPSGLESAIIVLAGLYEFGTRSSMLEGVPDLGRNFGRIVLHAHA